MSVRSLTSDGGSQSWPAILGTFPSFLLYKHSPACGTSALAKEEVDTLAAATPEIIIFQVDVIRQRELSARIASALSIRHESPQAILVRDGRAVWNASHHDITVPALVAALTQAGPVSGKVS